MLADTSAEIVFAAMEQASCFDRIDAVTNNHFDQDGLVGIWSLVDPQAALDRRERLVDVARAGDFGTFADRDSARIAMAIAALDDPDRAPRDFVRQPGYEDHTAEAYGYMLERLPGLLADPQTWRDVWSEEDEHLGRSLDAIATGKVTIDEHPEVDLAVVTIPEAWPPQRVHRFTQAWTETVHPMAVNCSTDRLRVLLVHGRCYRLELRYESWVMVVSRPVALRPDLAPLADRLSAAESGSCEWRADRVDALTPKLTSQGGSSLPSGAVVAEVRRYLATAPPAFDPFAGRRGSSASVG